MKKQKTNLFSIWLNGFLVALCSLALSGFAAAQANGVNLKFINQTNYPATIYWVEAGKERLYKTLKGTESFSQPTFETHQWRVRVNGKLVGTYVATTAPLQEIEITTNKSESPNRIRNQKEAETNCNTTAKLTNAVWIGKWGSLGKGQMFYCEFAILRFQVPEPVLQQPSVADLTVIDFINKTKYPMNVSQINLGGEEKPLKTLNAGESFSLSTSLYAGNRWNIKLNGKLVGTYDPTDKKSQKVEIAYDLSPVKQVRNQKEADEQCGKLAISKSLVWTGQWMEVGDSDVPVCQFVRLRISK